MLRRPASIDGRKLPEFPVTAPDNPDSEQKIGDGMRCDGVAKAALANDQPLIGEAAQNACQPLGMLKPKDQRGGQERRPAELAQGDLHKILIDNVAIEE